MSRPGALEVAGYYPFPPQLLPALARLLQPAAADAHGNHALLLLDPCAGEGVAAAALARQLTPDTEPNLRAMVIACELEAERGDAAAPARRHAPARDGDGPARRCLHAGSRHARLAWCPCPVPQSSLRVRPRARPARAALAGALHAVAAARRGCPALRGPTPCPGGQRHVPGSTLRAGGLLSLPGP